MKVLVTGGSGFIGQHAIGALRREGHVVITFDRKLGMDIMDLASVHAGVSQCDVVLHLAGILGSAERFADPGITIDINIKGSLNVFEAAQQQNKSVIYLGTKARHWNNPYLITKRTAAEFALMYSQYRGLRIAVVRAMNVYGSGQHWGRVQKAVPTFIVQALRNEPLAVYGDGTQVIDLIHVSDLCEIFNRILAQEKYGIDVEAGTGVSTSVNDLVALILRLTSSQSKVEYHVMRSGEPPNSATVADTVSLKQLLDYTPRVALDIGMEETVKWYAAHYLEVEDHG